MIDPADLDETSSRASALWRHLAARPAFLYALIGALVAALVVLLLRDPAPAAPVGVALPAAPAPEVKSTPKVGAPLKTRTVKAYPATAKKKTGIPATLQADPAVVLVAANQVQADEHPQTVTSVLNTDTGDFETFVRRDPLPWFAADHRGEAGISLGLKSGEPAVRLEARQNLFQVKAVHFGVTGSVDQPLNGAHEADWYLGVGAWYRW